MNSIRTTLAVAALGGAVLCHADYFDQYGNTTLVPGGPNGTAYELTSDVTVNPAYAGVYYVPDAGMTLNDVLTVSTDFSWLRGSFGGGAPRFSIGLNSFDHDPTHTYNDEVHVYWGTAPNFNDTPGPAWQNTGNLMSTPDLRYDTSQETGGAFYDTSGHMYSAYGTRGVHYVSLDLDGGWTATGTQQMDVTNFKVNNATIPVPEPASMAVLGLGGLALIRRRRSRRAN